MSFDAAVSELHTSKSSLGMEMGGIEFAIMAAIMVYFNQAKKDVSSGRIDTTLLSFSKFVAVGVTNLSFVGCYLHVDEDVSNQIVRAGKILCGRTDPWGFGAHTKSPNTRMQAATAQQQKTMARRISKPISGVEERPDKCASSWHSTRIF